MSPKFVFAFVAPTIAFALIFGSLTIYQQKNLGDLTRVGRWPQRDFSRQGVPETFTRDANVVDPDAQIAVIGDSFSQLNIWQTKLHQASGMAVTSWSFDGSTCVLPWVDRVLRDSPKVKVVILELVERSLIPRASSATDCSQDQSKLWNAPAGQINDRPTYWPLTLNVEFVGRSFLHAVQQDLSSNPEIRNDVVNVSLTRSDLFSNRRSDRLLYLAADETDWRASQAKVQLAIDRLTSLNATLARRNLKLIVLVVPDKSHTYRSWIARSALPNTKTNLALALQSNGVDAPDFLADFEQRAVTQKDFFRPDDTHLSILGFQFSAISSIRCGSSQYPR